MPSKEGTGGGCTRDESVEEDVDAELGQQSSTNMLSSASQAAEERVSGGRSKSKGAGVQPPPSSSKPSTSGRERDCERILLEATLVIILGAEGADMPSEIPNVGVDPLL